MSNRCSHCGYENREKARFCAECGAALPAVSSPGLTTDCLASFSQPTSAWAANGAAGPQPSERLREVDAEQGEAAHLPDRKPAAADLGVSAVVDEVAAGGGAEDAAMSTGADEGAEKQGPPSEAGACLSPGLLVAGRFYVLSSSADANGQQVYQVEDWGVCRACGREAADAADEPYCTNCGAQLDQLTLPWPLRCLQEVAAPADGEAHILWEGRTFALLDANDGGEVDKWAADGAARRASSPAAAADDALPLALTLLAGQRSDVGEARAGRTNEDSLFALTLTSVTDSLAHPAIGLYLVADGMGGHQDGEIASRTACGAISVDLLQSLVLPALAGVREDSAAVLALIEQAIQAANREIRELAGGSASNMGTTVVLALVMGDQMYVANVGDSRAYLWGRRGLRQITADHSHVFLLKQQGVIEEDEIYTHPRRNEIYRSLGFTAAVEVDCCQERLHPGDLLLLCSDGLWEMLRNEGIADVLLMNWGDPQVICDELVSRANGAGGEDNISVIAVRAVGQVSQ